MSWLGRAGARLLPAGRRDWAEAVWAEAYEVPAGWPRLAWILIFGAPLVAGAIAGRRSHVPGPPGELTDDRAKQGIAAGVVSGGVGALFVTVFGTGTTVLFVNSAWVQGLLLHGQHLTASAVYGRELFATQNAGAYVILCVAFPIIGTVMGFMGAGLASVTGPRSADRGRLTEAEAAA